MLLLASPPGLCRLQRKVWLVSPSSRDGREKTLCTDMSAAHGCHRLLPNILSTADRSTVGMEYDSPAQTGQATGRRAEGAVGRVPREMCGEHHPRPRSFRTLSSNPRLKDGPPLHPLPTHLRGPGGEPAVHLRDLVRPWHRAGVEHSRARRGVSDAGSHSTPQAHACSRKAVHPSRPPACLSSFLSLNTVSRV